MAKAKEQTEVATQEQSLGQPVKLARLHQPADIKGAFGMEKSLNCSRIPGLKMWWDGNVLHLECKDQKAFIPGANVAVGVFE